MGCHPQSACTPHPPTPRRLSAGRQLTTANTALLCPVGMKTDMRANNKQLSLHRRENPTTKHPFDSLFWTAFDLCVGTRRGRNAYPQWLQSIKTPSGLINMPGLYYDYCLQFSVNANLFASLNLAGYDTSSIL